MAFKKIKIGTRLKCVFNNPCYGHTCVVSYIDEENMNFSVKWDDDKIEALCYRNWSYENSFEILECESFTNQEKESINTSSSMQESVCITEILCKKSYYGIDCNCPKCR